MEYKVDDTGLHASAFIPFANQIWPGDYDAEKTQSALSKTLNITVYDGERLVGCLRILSDGYFFRDDYGAACTARISEAGNWKQAPAACPREYANHAILWRPAGLGSLL